MNLRDIDKTTCILHQSEVERLLSWLTQSPWSVTEDERESLKSILSMSLSLSQTTMTDADCEEFISNQLSELGTKSGVIVQPDGCSKEQFQRVAERMGCQVSDEVPIECTAGLGMPKAMKRKETATFKKRTSGIFRPVADCHHCDAPLPKSYLRWHAARALRRPDRMAMLTCKKCGCWTPVRFDQHLEAQPA